MQTRERWPWVGDSIRLRVAIPEDWKWPVVLSLSLEFGCQRRFSPGAWTLEIRPRFDSRSVYLDLSTALFTAPA